MSLEDEILKRKTFGIISHPDAGKTTLTEKLLLFGGAIQVAGAVKNNKIKKTAASDFMDIERQRGISVATSVMAFHYKDKLINLLDTPGHKDFAEDTYRTLTAVDSVILVIDCVKGVEMQTERLMEVCRMRDTPVIVFINKMDLEGRDAFELLDELEEKLNIKVRPMSWPIGIGRTFQGVYKIYDKSLNLFQGDKTKRAETVLEINGLEDPELVNQIGDEAADELKEEVELVEGVYDSLDVEKYRAGEVAPVFFGSAVNNFGLYDTGNFNIGDTLTEGEKMTFQGIPSFSPEIFKEVVNKDPMKSKQLEKGVRQLTDEGVAQLFVMPIGNRKIIGTVGELQFEVIQHRLENEYGAKCEFQSKNYFKACWITSDNEEKLKEFIRIKGMEILKDKDENEVYLAPSEFLLNMERQNYPEIEFHFTSEFKTQAD